ncbi:MAG: septum formation protein Maf [Clostridia bacterium]|nr:septum formation protein Maf [Clostridia bacterium]
MKVVLASASPRRKELLSRIYDEFIIEEAGIEETLPEDIGTEFAPLFLAAAKADAVAQKHRNDLVIAADTIVVFNNEKFGKPKDRSDAKRMLTCLSGKTHKVLTGCCISIKGENVGFVEESYVSFYPLSEEDIESYLDTNEPMDKAGAYAIQGKGALLVKSIDGDYNNIVGLPIARLKREIDELLKDYRVKKPR